MSAKAKSAEFIGTGRRKTSTARVRIKEGTGKYFINGRELMDYCKTEQQRKAALSPLLTVEKTTSVDVRRCIAAERDLEVHFPRPRPPPFFLFVSRSRFRNKFH